MNKLEYRYRSLMAATVGVNPTARLISVSGREKGRKGNTVFGLSVSRSSVMGRELVSFDTRSCATAAQVVRLMCATAIAPPRSEAIGA